MTDATRDFFDTLAKVLFRCWVYGFLLLAIWLIALLSIRETIHELHGLLFGLSDHELDLVFYGGMGLLKMWVLACFFIPWLAIRMALWKP